MNQESQKSQGMDKSGSQRKDANTDTNQLYDKQLRNDRATGQEKQEIKEKTSNQQDKKF